MEERNKQQIPLTEATGLSRREIMRILKDLERQGIIEIKRDKKGRIEFNENGDVYVKPINMEKASG